MTKKVTSQKDLYQAVTDKIVKALEKGSAPWRRTWTIYGLPKNYASGHHYCGINQILMLMTDHKIPYFMTFKQAKQLGGKVKKGSKSEKVYYFNFAYKDEDGKNLTPQQKAEYDRLGKDYMIIPFLKQFSVFNIEDIEGIEFDAPELQLQEHEKIQKCEDIISGMKSRPDILTVNPNQPYYNKQRDYVNMPDMRQFNSSEAYYCTLYHEIAHSTGHPKRLNREGIRMESRYGTTRYGVEELISEMTACFVCSKCGILAEEILSNSTSYLASWLNSIKKDKKFIFKVVADAHRAANYILNKKVE
jgi:antirestriction protein ArdC